MYLLPSIEELSPAQRSDLRMDLQQTAHHHIDSGLSSAINSGLTSPGRSGVETSYRTGAPIVEPTIGPLRQA